MSSDSMETNAMSTQLFPVAPTLSEHHRVLNLDAAAHERHLATFKAHKILIKDLDERVDEIKDSVTDLSNLSSDLAKTNAAVTELKQTADQLQRSLTSHGAIVGEVVERLKDREGKLDVRKTVISGIFGLLVAIVAALGGYWAHPSGGPSYQPPTHAQAVQIDQAYKAMNPENQNQFQEHR